jgi:AraC family ethanolamine operon transcriptional activator
MPATAASVALSDARLQGSRAIECTDPARASYSDRRCGDADEHAAALRDWDQRYDQLSTGRFEGRITEAWTDGVQMFRERTAPVTQQHGRAWAGACTLALVLGGESEATFCGQPVRPSQGAVIGAGSEFTLLTPRRFDIVGIAVRSSLIASHADRTGDAALAAATEVGTEILSDGALLAPMRDCARDWFDALHEAPSLVEQPAVHASLLSSVLGVLATVCDRSAPGGGAHGGLLPDARNRLVERARTLVAARADTPMTVADLCGELRVSRRTLQYSFQQVLGVNPVQYLRAVRLNGVRRDLKRAVPGARIGDVAARWGFWHLSQFSADYRRMFGELPSETVRLRG